MSRSTSASLRRAPLGAPGSGAAATLRLAPLTPRRGGARSLSLTPSAASVPSGPRTALIVHCTDGFFLGPATDPRAPRGSS